MARRWTRRETLAAGSATLALLAGCTGSTDSGPTDDNSPDSPTPGSSPRNSPEESDDTALVTVERVTALPAIVGAGTPDSLATYGQRDEQFLLPRVTTSDSAAPTYAEFSLTAGDQTHDAVPLAEVMYGNRVRNLEGSVYEAPGSGYLVIPVPKPLGAADAALTWPGGQHSLDGSVLQQLRRPPTDFSITNASAPATVEAGDVAAFQVTVKNVGSVAGTFVGALNRTGPQVAYMPVDSFELELAPGESKTWTHEREVGLRGTGELTYKFRWRGDRITRTITIEESGTPES